MHPSVHARTDPDKPALIVAETGETVELCRARPRDRTAWRSCSGRAGWRSATRSRSCLENVPEFFALHGARSAPGCSTSASRPS